MGKDLKPANELNENYMGFLDFAVEAYKETPAYKNARDEHREGLLNVFKEVCQDVFDRNIERIFEAE